MVQFKKTGKTDFPCNPVVNTPCFHRTGLDLIPSGGTNTCMQPKTTQKRATHPPPNNEINKIPDVFEHIKKLRLSENLRMSHAISNL